MSALQQWLVAGGFAALMMSLVYLWQRRSGNAGYVDAAWSLCIGVISIALAIMSEAPAQRRLLSGGIIGLWSLRLTIYLLRRLASDESEDGRYKALRHKWGARFQFKIFWFYQLQAASTLAFALAPWLASRAQRSPLDGWDFLGLTIGLVGITGVTLSDWQLSRFKQRPESKGRTCRIGLWRYSRHPNYFFEWVHWWAYLPIAAGAVGWWAAAVPPSLLLYFILYKTGIPPTEQQAVASRGDEYRQYQRTTSAFVPWFPKREHA